MALRETYPDVFITILNRQSSHKKYKAESTAKVRKFLNEFRSKIKYSEVYGVE